VARLGAKLDSTASDPVTGDIDEFRLYRQALTGDQLDQLRTANAAVLDAEPEAAVNKALGLRLPFQPSTRRPPRPGYGWPLRTTYRSTVRVPP
jgi:hypothetical protein